MAAAATHHHLIFICCPTIGNLVPAVEFAVRLTDHDSRFFATFLIIDLPERPLVNSYTQSRFIQSYDHNHNNIQFIHLPTVDPPARDLYHSSLAYQSLIILKHIPNIKKSISDILKTTDSGSIFVDMFTTAVIDVAIELDIPSYLFFASPATFLSLMIHLPTLEGDQVLALFQKTDLVLPGFSQPLPSTMLPSTVLNHQDGFLWYVQHGRRYCETKGIIVNSFTELETHALDSLSMDDTLPPVYAVGPILDLVGPDRWQPTRAENETVTVMKWLDEQPTASVILLSFGSMGSLDGLQVKEIAIGLERAGYRFVWALREPPKAHLHLPDDYSNLDGVLPEGFLDRTAGVGLVCGWVPQVKILAHRAIGGFVSHCGWNSILESLWYGVPIATWPVYAEQEMNAFEMVKELGLAVELRLDYREGSDLVRAAEVESGLRRLMDGGDEVRTRVKLMGEKCKTVLKENGSSYQSLNSLTHELTARIS